MSPDAHVDVGFEIPEWTMDDVDPERMKTMAAILRDPYPVHWDRSSVADLGLGARVINQGPLNLSYITNMLLAWQGPTCVRRLQVEFGRPVLDHDRVTAAGTVVSLETVDGERRAHCEVRLERDGTPVVTGTAVVALDTTLAPGTTVAHDNGSPNDTNTEED
ncbi:MAG: MaoC family dehydratase [Ilumatobacter sp.]|uniref:MaoC family dehydratase n=1 Tax=Ilumatobacter sp. TaxID=1967498 RepID=UPI003C77263D